MARRFDLSDAHWERLEPLLPVPPRPGRPSLWSKRQLIDGIRWRVRSPRSGDKSDKLGNYYEGQWIIWQILEVTVGRTESITIEELSDGAEFVLRSGTKVELHQFKLHRRRSSTSDCRAPLPRGRTGRTTPQRAG
ncbi:transposase [Lentzea sp. NBRC 102530]|uniref:transposase n=1 Tax=Lentzea sp. NBRC 102530 TaxID=3032201 RepID=UPI0024A3F3CA|nr:transposase [Lentzea sp. NBRC 102530]GLY51416.1 hypothetical protein Lesp01_50720 [Lentzea sp. NBRC 102530]